jgi:hypothetical protein
MLDLVRLILPLTRQKSASLVIKTKTCNSVKGKKQAVENSVFPNIMGISTQKNQDNA